MRELIDHELLELLELWRVDFALLDIVIGEEPECGFGISSVSEDVAVFESAGGDSVNMSLSGAEAFLSDPLEFPSRDEVSFMSGKYSHILTMGWKSGDIVIIFKHFANAPD